MTCDTNAASDYTLLNAHRTSHQWINRLMLVTLNDKKHCLHVKMLVFSRIILGVIYKIWHHNYPSLTIITSFFSPIEMFGTWDLKTLKKELHLFFLGHHSKFERVFKWHLSVQRAIFSPILLPALQKAALCVKYSLKWVQSLMHSSWNF